MRRDDVSVAPVRDNRKVVIAALLAAFTAIPLGIAQEQPAGDGGIGPADGDLQQIPPIEGFEPGDRVNISEGEIEVLEFLRFLSAYTGLPVFVDSTQLANMKPITIAAPIRDADDEIVKALLRSNRMEVNIEELGNGRQVIKVTSLTAPATGGEAQNEMPILDVDQSRVRKITDEVGDVDQLGLEQDQLATMVFHLRHVEPKDAIDSLTKLLGGSSAAKARQSGFSLVEVPNTKIVIITAKFGLINYFRKLLSIIDVPVPESDRIVEIVDIEYAYADELVATIESFLEQGRLGRRTGGSVARPAGSGGARPSSVSTRRSGDDLETQLIADPRTNKIIIETYDERDLEDIFMLIRELDVRYEMHRMKTHIYQVRYLKADEVAADLQSLLGASGGTRSGSRTLSRGTGAGRTRGVSRIGQSQARSPAQAAPGAAGGGPAAQGGPALIVPHIQTNSLLVQAEPEDYAEIINVLREIDTKRRQVFLEAALVQVTSSSSLNYTIELLAGNPDDRATRALVESSFGLSGIDLENFNRVIPDLSNPQAVPSGALLAVMNRGKFPALIRFFKANSDTQVLATPFILADDNMPNLIQILETQFVQTTATTAAGQTSSQEAEDAGIVLEITPTISSEQAVFLEMSLEVSEFSAQAATAQVLPPKLTNTITSAVTVPDGQLFVIGGLTRENKSKTVSKVPILGDIPLIGKAFRSEASSKSLSNLYIFLRAHVLTHPNFADHFEITDQARGFVQRFAEDLEPTNFAEPTVQDPPPPRLDPDAPGSFDLRPQGVRRPLDRSGYFRRERERYENDPNGPPGATPPIPRRSFPEATPAGGVGLPDDDDEPAPTRPSLDDPVSPRPTRPTPPEAEVEEPTGEAGRLERALEGTGAEVDSARDGWLPPLKPSN